jgi:hypothetical protein
VGSADIGIAVTMRYEWVIPCRESCCVGGWGNGLWTGRQIFPCGLRVGASNHFRRELGVGE